MREVCDFGRIDTHDMAAGRVDGDDVVAHCNQSEVFGPTHDRTVAFHRCDSVDDGERWPYRCGEIEDGRVDAAHVEDVLRPAVNRARHDAEQVFHGASHRCPMMSLE